MTKPFRPIRPPRASGTPYRALKAAYDTDQAAYDKQNAAYTAWYKYFSSEKQSADTAQELLSNSARNTVVKSASFPVDSDGFTAAKTLSDGTGAYQFLPAVSPDAGSPSMPAPSTTPRTKKRPPRRRPRTITAPAAAA